MKALNCPYCGETMRLVAAYFQKTRNVFLWQCPVCHKLIEVTDAAGEKEFSAAEEIKKFVEEK